MKCSVKSSERREPVDPASLHLPAVYPWRVLNSLYKDLRQYLTEEDQRLIEGIVRNRDVEVYLSLKQLWGLQCITLDASSSLSLWKARYALASLLAKFQFPGSQDKRRSKALEKFRAAEDSCRRFNREGIDVLRNHGEPWVHNAIFHARAFIERLLGYNLPSSSALTLWSKHGPGATVDAKDGYVSSYNKFENVPYQCTAAAFRHAKALIKSDERWLGALEDNYRELNGIPRHAILNRKMFWASVLQIVQGAEVRFVPKNAEIFRTITIEPTLNVYLQLGVDGFIRRRLKRWGVDLDDQSRNQRLARRGSLHWEEDDPYVTVDLSAASDTIARRLVEYFLPPEWYCYLLDLRSPCATLEAETFYFQKISAMGNGFTFCLESLIFTSLIYGVMMTTNGHFDREDFAVYGDDLIVRRSLLPRLKELLTLTGFTLNAEKTFTEGPIRESCGTDWARGIPIRPVFLETVPTDVKQLFSARNRLKRMLELRWGMEESETVSKMDTWIPEIFRDCMGPISDEEYDTHIHTAKCGRFCHNKGQMWVYRQVHYVPVLQRGCASFSFRKLMHNLRAKPVGEGSVFTVHRRTSTRTVRTKLSTASYWREEYAEALPV